MMRIIIAAHFLVSLLCYPVFLCAQENGRSFKIYANFKNGIGKTIYIRSYNHSAYTIIDSFKITSEKKEFILPLIEPGLLMLTCENKNELFMVNWGNNFLEWDLADSLRLIPKKNHLNEIRLLYDSLISNKYRIEFFRLMQINNDQNERAADSISELQKIAYINFEAATKAYIRNCKNSFFSLYLLRHHYRSWNYDTVNKLFTQIARPIRKFPSAKPIDSFLKYTKKVLPINQLTYINTKQKIEKKDYYVIDFWGSWCKPCIAAIPELKSLYESYKSRNIGLIGVAYETDKDLTSLYSIINKFEISWPQALVQNKPGAKNIIPDYFIFEFPTYFLLDKNHKIIYRGTGSDALTQINRLLDQKEYPAKN